jgi:hypothetical protein
MKITNKTSSEQVKSKLLWIADGVINKSVDTKVANAAVGTYRTLFQLISLEIKADKKRKR